MVNVDLKRKILAKKKDEEEDQIFYITSELCIDEGNTDNQLWERYRPEHKVILEFDWCVYFTANVIILVDVTLTKLYFFRLTKKRDWVAINLD